MLIRYSLVPPLGHLCGSERPQHPTNPSMESELSRLSNRPGQCAVVFLPHSTIDFLSASSAPQWATYLKLYGFRSGASCQIVQSCPRKIFDPKMFWKAKRFDRRASDFFSKRHLRVRVLSPQPRSRSLRYHFRGSRSSVARRRRGRCGFQQLDYGGHTASALTRLGKNCGDY
jgi:hypothetical protein